MSYEYSRRIINSSEAEQELNRLGKESWRVIQISESYLNENTQEYCIEVWLECKYD